MKTLRFPAFMLFVVATLFAFSSCTKEDSINVLPVDSGQQLDTRGTGNTTPAGPTIVDLAIATPELSVLVDAVIKADLVDALSAPGNLTVFAPTNEAFAALLDAAGFASLDEVPVDVLTTILLTHVLPQENFAADFSTGYFKTLAVGPVRRPTDIYVSTADGVTINGGINVVLPDVDATNGVVHVIDQVINPSDIVTLAASNPNFSSLVAALTRPDLSVDFIGALNSGGTFTVLAPTNAAFQALLDSNPAWNSLGDIPAATLEAVLLYHVSATGNLTSNFFARRPRVNTLLEGATYTTAISFSGGLSIEIVANSNRANVIAADVQAQNGVIHAIDTVILP